MSSLAAQLSALTNQKSASRRHEDVVGRGFGYTAAAGGGSALVTTEASAKFKATVVYSDAKEASDVPTSLIRAKCYEALKKLGKQYDDPVLSSFSEIIASPASLHTERALLTVAQNAAVDQKVTKLLSHLSTTLHDKLSLDVLEYLVRRYDVHLRNGEELLVSSLASHDSFLFSRLLQLVNVAESSLLFFLRPHAAPGAPPVPRDLLSKRCSKDDVLLSKICALARNAADVHVACVTHGSGTKDAHEQQGAGREAYDSKLPGPPPPHISRVLSFATAVVVDALALMRSSSSRPTSSSSPAVDGVSESTVRLILPSLVDAVGPSSRSTGCLDYRAFGYVLAAALAGGGHRGGGQPALGSAGRELVTGAMLNGANESDGIMLDATKMASDDEEQDKSMVEDDKRERIKYSLERLENSSDAILAVMGTLLQGPAQANPADYLPLSTFRLLSKMRILPAALGHIQSKGQNVATFVRALLARAVGHLHTKQAPRLAKLVEALTTVPELKRAVWASLPSRNVSSPSSEAAERLVTDLNAFLASAAAGNPDVDAAIAPFIAVLRALRAIDPPGADYGVAHAVKTIGSKLTPKTVAAVESVVGGMASSYSASNPATPGSPNEQGGVIPAGIPPRVALEHPDSSVRLAAVESIVSTLRAGLDDAKEEVIDEDLAQSLFHRFVADDDIAVAIKAGAGYLELLRKAPSPTAPPPPDVGSCLAALDKWGLAVETEQSHFKRSRMRKKKHAPKLAEAAKIAIKICGIALGAAGRGTRQAADLAERLMSLLPCTFYGVDGFPFAAAEYTGGPFAEGEGADEIDAVATEAKSALAGEDESAVEAFASFVAGVEGQKPLSPRCTYAILSDLSRIILSLVCADSPPLNSRLECLLKLFTSSEIETSDAPSLIKSLLTVRGESSFNAFSIPAIKFVLEQTSWGVLQLLELATSFAPDCYQASQRAIVLATTMLVQNKSASSSSNGDAAIGKKSSKKRSSSAEDLSRPSASIPVSASAVIPSFALLTHPERIVRKSAIIFVEEFSTVPSIPEQVALLASQACTGNALELEIDMNALPRFVALAFSGQSSKSLRHVFLSMMKDNIVDSIKDCLSFSSVSTVLKVLEVAGGGEDIVFPLAERWELCGKFIWKSLVESSESIPQSAASLLRNVVRMMRGVAGDGSGFGSGITIAGRNGRVRSYSVSESSFVFPLPASLVAAYTESLEMKSNASVRDEVVAVMKKHSWADNVFVKLDAPVRLAIATNLLTIRTKATTGNVENASKALETLPLNCSEIIALIDSADLTKKSTIDHQLLSLTILSEFVASSTLPMITESIESSYVVAKLLFNKLSQLAAMDLSDGGVDYVKTTLLSTLLTLMSSFPKGGADSSVNPSKEKKRRRSSSNLAANAAAGTKSNSGSEFSAYAQLLVNMVGGADTFAPLSQSCCQCALSLLTVLCGLSPATVASSLLPALQIVTVQGEKVEDVRSFQIMNDALMAVIPSYCTNAKSADLTLMDLMRNFVDFHDEISSHRRSGLFAGLMSAMMRVKKFVAVGPLIATILAFHSRSAIASGGSDKESDHGRGFCLSLVQRSPTSEQVHAMLQLLKYASELLAHLGGADAASDSQDDFWDVSYKEFSDYASKGIADDTKKRTSTMLLTTNILLLIKSQLSHHTMPLIVKNTKGAQSKCLELWERLLSLQSTAAVVDKDGVNRDEKLFWSAAPDSAQECMNLLQKLLSVPNFIVSTKTLIENGSEVDPKLRKQSLILLGERAAEAVAGGGEYELFLEMVAELVEIVSDEDADDFVKQAGLIAIERLAKNLVGVEKGQGADVFTSALRSASAALASCCSHYVSTGEANEKVIQSSALCVSAVVGVIKARALQSLAPIVNAALGALEKKSAVVDDDDSASGIVHVAALRVLLAVAAELPQFLGSSLSRLLAVAVSVDATLSDGAMNVDGGMSSIASSLRTAIATQVPPRLLAPALAKLLANCLEEQSWVEQRRALDMFCVSVNAAARKDLAPMINVCVDGLLLCYQGAISEGVELSETNKILEASNNLLVAIVMKGSETQFKPIYTKVKEWSDEEDEDGTVNASRRYVFWSANARLSRELRGIFLPCLSSSMPEAVDLLNLAVTIFTESGKKRKRVAGDAEDKVDILSLAPLQPLLLCLETALKSDSHDGGGWAKADSGSRYNQLLKPLCKLLEAKVPPSFKVTCAGEASVHTKATSYDKLVGGVGTSDCGSVVGCCIALAHAAGSEQLWKPLNHSIVQACGSDRADVRIAGLKILIGILGTLGEEYLSLLPECLPVLSELLEDENDHIVLLTKQCVKIAEELSGESFDEFLA